jgi:hypothetical protein
LADEGASYRFNGGGGYARGFGGSSVSRGLLRGSVPAAATAVGVILDRAAEKPREGRLVIGKVERHRRR